jgi:hypothetical protein
MTWNADQERASTKKLLAEIDRLLEDARRLGLL